MRAVFRVGSNHCLFEYLMPSETSGRAPVPYEKTDRYPTR
ncbi:hypothetical protein F528_1725 [Neisseria meningitidis 992008]|uniref:Uncharacterized protein n=2 Tax=Neisseria meningitidis TaxID=487 RepID=A0A0H5Q8I0_NEIMI|nr:hypothetical protein HMPREF0602_0626 [Neisseria meningitidis ATCC 13091]KER39344.1 hypothetical protein F528_1725 [Neisseria meningitidis 992008]CRY98306.1 FIG00849658: hypothetical protein [Neisseria meningitidis serogroup B]